MIARIYSPFSEPNIYVNKKDKNQVFLVKFSTFCKLIIGATKRSITIKTNYEITFKP